MSIDITIEEMEALPAESYELFDIRGEIERAHGILPNSSGKLSRCTDGESAGR